MGQLKVLTWLLNCFEKKTPDKSAKRSSPKMAVAYGSDQGFWVRPQSITADRLRLTMDPIIHIAATASCEEIGKAVMDVLELSQEGIPRPNLRKPLPNHTSILQETGFKSFGPFAKRIKQVGVSMDENANEVEITPFEYLGKSTFQGKSDLALICRADDGRILGKTLKKALKL